MRGRRIAQKVSTGQLKSVTLISVNDRNARQRSVARSTTKREICGSIMPRRNEYDEMNDDSELTVVSASHGSQLYSVLQIDWTLEYI